ncbi:MAG: ArsA-related P-loop ATPase [Nanoarchaeota archaeon]
MDLTIFAGKGGVGKSTSAVAYALATAEKGDDTLIIDFDGGHSVARTLDVITEEKNSNSMVCSGIQKISLGVVDRIKYSNIAEYKLRGEKTADYLEQFTGAQGLVPYHDMATEFFGLLTDINTVSSFASLMGLLEDAERKKVKKVVIDVEPTAGLERLLTSTKQMTRSLTNLQNRGIVIQTVIRVWPDIKACLDGEYITHADKYLKTLEKTAERLKRADYNLVCVPEEGPVGQIEQVEELIKNYGGEIKAYVINNIRGEPGEGKQIRRVKIIAKGRPIIRVERDRRIQDWRLEERRELLKNIGRKIIAA